MARDNQKKREYREFFLEKYLYENLSFIEKGMIPICRQYRNVWHEKRYRFDQIDILAKDKNDIPVIIEVKIKAHPRVLHQISFYMKHYPSDCRGVIAAEEFHPQFDEIYIPENIKLFKIQVNL